MSWVLFLAAFALGFGACGIFVWFAQSRNLPGPGQHTGPMLLADEKPSHPRFGELIETPADGIEAVRDDGVIRVGAHERNIQRRQTPDHPPWTGSQPALTEDQVIEQNRQAWARAQLEALGSDPTNTGVGRVFAGLRALPASSVSVSDGLRKLEELHVFGEAPVATVLAATAEAEAAA